MSTAARPQPGDPGCPQDQPPHPLQPQRERGRDPQHRLHLQHHATTNARPHLRCTACTGRTVQPTRRRRHGPHRADRASRKAAQFGAGEGTRTPLKARSPEFVTPPCGTVRNASARTFRRGAAASRGCSCTGEADHFFGRASISAVFVLRSAFTRCT